MARTGRARERLARSFDRSAALYERGRPDYPDAAIRFAARTLHLGQGSVVVDLAAGTGKLTRALQATGAAIVAVEPAAGMRRVFRSVVPDVPVVPGTAEAIPLPSGFADAVFVGQAFHWFRGPAALREIARVLKPRGAVVLLWNTRDDRVRWSRELTAIVERVGGRSSHRVVVGGGWRRAFHAVRRPFGALHKRTFSHAQSASPETYVARLLSTSHVAVQAPAVRRRVAAQFRHLLATDPRTRGRRVIDLPYRTELYFARVRRVRARPRQ
jgi:ubiquinone/menaquinone biosynthesis C-methylase UbiE